MRLLVLVPPGDDAEATGAVAWGRAAGLAVRAIRMDAAASAPVIAPGEIPWCHAGARVPPLPPEWARSLGAWVQDGGRMLLTLLAAPLASMLGAPGPPPEVQLPTAWRDEDDPLWPADFRDWPDYPHVRGGQGWGTHALFDGLGRGTYTWRATEGELVARCSYRRPRWPSGAVLAVERAYVALHADEAVAWAFGVGAGHLLCLGANVAFTAASHALVPQRDRYLQNALAMLDAARDWPVRAGHAWPVRGETRGSAPNVGGVPATQVEPPALAPLAPVHAVPGGQGVDGGVRATEWGDRVLRGVLAMSGNARADAAITLAGRRALVVGNEVTGVQEVWMHPACVASEGLRLSVDGEALTPLEVQVTPHAVARLLADVRGSRWREVVAVAPDTALVRYELAPLGDEEGAEPLRGVARIAMSLRVRLQWPMPGDALGPLSARQRQAGGRAIVCVGAADAPLELRLAGDGVQAMSIEASGDTVRAEFTAAPGGALRLAVAGDVAGAAALAPAWRELCHESMDGLLERLARRDAQRSAATVQVTTEESRLDVACEWAKARLSAFVVSVPGVGTGLTAGYAASRPGWGDSRPGYAWFFGRDACWCADALLAAGLFDEARQALEFLAETADVTGKIAHEVTTSGVRHYDAADATPLWLMFAARYGEWTGDVSTLRSLRHAIARGVDFVLSTDRDGDGLPDNTGVGHGWIESGPLGGGALTSYTAAIWIDALRRLQPVARWLGDEALAVRVSEALTGAEAAFERRLRDGETGRVYLQRRAARAGARASDVADDDLTALSAVPILLGVDRAASADAVVARLSDDDFAAPWGVRLLSRRDARYRPRGYHVGAVWPLYTGWASLAAFARGEPERGWRHLLAVADAAFHRQRGAFDEVLDGDTGEGAGICPDQAWSAAMIITPFVDGMLGMTACAPEGRCALAPQWPGAWREARVSGVRVGGSRFSLAMHRDDGALHYSFVLDEGAPLEVQLAGAGEAVGTLGPGIRRTVSRPAAGGRDVGR